MLPAFMPKVQIVAQVPRGISSTVRSLCEEAGIECRVTGPATEREIYFHEGKLDVCREPGFAGAVAIGLPEKLLRSPDPKPRAILALGILAYAVFDYVARESMRGRPEGNMALPAGRPRKARSLTGAERQARWRQVHRPAS
jgi:hypothetical protein